jgi:hypothetical protein
MKKLKLFLWIPGIILILLIAAASINTKSEGSFELSNSYLKKHTWAYSYGKNQTETNGNSIRKIEFRDNQEFEVIKTFEFSGSVFRTPGKYLIKDSTVHLKTLNGSNDLGKAYINEQHQMKIKWSHSTFIYGKGTQIYRVEELPKNSRNRVFSFKLFNFSVTD